VSARGWDSFRVLCFDDRRVRGLLEACAAMGELEVVSKRPVERTLAEEHFLVPGAEIVGGLTHRQREALLLALDAGYYEVPRRATVQDIAQRQGRPRTTFEEHLRKAEGKLIRAVAPLVALGAARRFSADARRGPRTRSRAARRTAPSGAPSGARRPRGGRAGG
jgi:predicted DNA binding protein